MKVIIEEKDFIKEFQYYDDYVGGRDDKIVAVKFWCQGQEYKVDEIELIFDKKEIK